MAFNEIDRSVIRVSALAYRLGDRAPAPADESGVRQLERSFASLQELANLDSDVGDAALAEIDRRERTWCLQLVEEV